MLSGTRANIAVKVFGDDLPTLRRLGERVREAMAGVPGVADLSLEQQMDVPFVRFVLTGRRSPATDCGRATSPKRSKPALPAPPSAGSSIAARPSICS